MALLGEYEPSTVAWVREEVEHLERTGQGLRGRSVVLLATVGARTGLLRKTPLMRVEHDGAYLAVGSLGGAPKNPVWVYNLRANPLVELQDGEVKQDYTAREVTGAERDLWWERSVAAFPQYLEYTKKTDRLIPVFVLSRV